MRIWGNILLKEEGSEKIHNFRCHLKWVWMLCFYKLAHASSYLGKRIKSKINNSRLAFPPQLYCPSKLGYMSNHFRAAIDL